MANLRSTMDAAFWNHNIATPLTLDGVARSIPGEPVPLDVSRSSKLVRMQQLNKLRKMFPFRLVPGFHPAFNEELGGHSLQTSLALPVNNRWWLGLIGQLRPMKVTSGIASGFKEEFHKTNWEDSPFIIATNFATTLAPKWKLFFDKTLFTSIGLCSRLALSSSTFLEFSTEKHAEKKGRRSKAFLIHKIQNHDITLEAGWPELFVDHNGKYWDVPKSISLDCCSSFPDPGLRYRFGIHKNSGYPEADGIVNGDAPLSLMPGLCAKAAFSFEKSLYRKIFDRRTDVKRLSDELRYGSSYDFRLAESHAAISGIIGSTGAAWFGKTQFPMESADDGNNVSMGAKRRRSPLTANTFGSVCATFQHGGYQKTFFDLTRVDARLDIASGLAKKIFWKKSVDNSGSLFASPRLNLIFQQQILGPLLFRIDSRFLLGSFFQKSGPQVEDVVYSLIYGLRTLRSGKVTAWYSPKRKEGMVELRIFEF